MIGDLTGARRAVRASVVRGAVVSGVVVAALVVLAACGSSSKTTANTTGSGASSSTTSAGGSGNGNQSDQLSAMATAIKSGKQVTFKAEYTYSGAGISGPITIEQKPPKTLFKTGDAEVLGTGTTTYYCSVSGSQPTCLNAGNSNPLTAITQLFNPDNAATAIQAAQAQVAAHQAGYNVSFSTETFAGASSDCATITSASVTGKYCVTKSGVLAYSGTGTANFQLTSYSTSVSDSDFALPAGASTQTIPSVP